MGRITINSRSNLPDEYVLLHVRRILLRGEDICYGYGTDTEYGKIETYPKVRKGGVTFDIRNSQEV